MKIEDLPVGSRPPPIDYPHFPTRWQAVVWRNWGLVPVVKLAEVLQGTEAQIRQAAVDMGLEAAPQVNPKWITHSYLTIIRNNWQLLPYSQIIKLLDWTSAKMAYTLKEEDFCWGKLGKLKPECPLQLFTELTPDQQTATARMKQLVCSHFPEDEMARLDPPFSFLNRFAPVSSKSGDGKFEFNFIHSYCASCGDVIGTAETLDPVPENLLAQYASMGIKGIWLHTLLYLLFPVPGAEEFSVGHEKRLNNLKRIVERCAGYGIKVYLYLNEPRCMPLPFYDIKPEWAGYDIPSLNTKTICTTRSPEPLNWLEITMKKLFTEAVGLGGVFCITMSENPTNCQSAFQREKCPFCRDIVPEKIIVGVIAAMERGMHAADPEAKMIAYDWSWRTKPTLDDPDKITFKKKILDLLPKTVCVQSVSEWGLTTLVGNVEQYLVDYSISQVGPSPETLAVWEHARKLGLKVAAKVQINNSWELSAIPYIPVPYLIQEHLNNLKKAGVSGLMLSWTLGGFPGGNLDILKASPEEIAASKFNPELAAAVCNAWKQFSEAFRQFPFDAGGVLYTAPMNYGPMNLLHLKKTGYTATMLGFPYDDLTTWRGPYPEDIFEEQFRLTTTGWMAGLDILQQNARFVAEKERGDYKEIFTIALAGYCHLYSTYMQIRFIRARDNGFDKTVMVTCLKQEIETAKRLYDIVLRDSRIGFEASNHYYYTLNDLREKVISCADILSKLSD